MADYASLTAAAVTSAIVAGLDGVVSGLEVRSYEPLETQLGTGIVVELDAAEISDAENDDRPAWAGSWIARVIVAGLASGSQAAARAGAMAVAEAVYGNRWGLSLPRPTNISVAEEPAADDAVVVWAVRWRQVWIGGDEEESITEEITAVFVGYEPDVGPDHIDDYEQVVP